MHVDEAEYVQRVGPLVELPAVLRSFGIDPPAVLARAGLGPDALDDPVGMIPFQSFGEVLAAGVAATACPHFGLLVGSRARPDHFGIVGNLFHSAPTLGAAIVDLVTNQHRYIRGSVFHLLAGKGRSTFSYSVLLPAITGLDQIFDAVMASCFVVYRGISAAVPFSVSLSRKRPAQPAPYVHLFGYMPQFDAPVTSLTYYQHDLVATIPAADAVLRSESEAAVEGYWIISQPDLIDRARRAIAARLYAGDAGKAAIAAALGMHPRMLSRRLLELGTSFRELAKAQQTAVASQLLLGTDLTVSTIALTLGYSSPAAFVKAFRHDIGMSPGEWRRHMRKQSDALT